MTRARSADLAHLAHLTDTGRLHPAVDRVFPAAAVAAAHAHAQTSARGKVVVTLTE